MSDFGASRGIPIERSGLTTAILLCGLDVVKLFGQAYAVEQDFLHSCMAKKVRKKKLHFPKAPRHEAISDLGLV